MKICDDLNFEYIINLDMKRINFLITLSILYFYAFYYKKISFIKTGKALFSYPKKEKFRYCCNKNITALVFFGRKQNVEILIKYLIANLRKNGGILDKIKFAVKTKNTNDLNYLDELIKLYPKEFSKNNYDPGNKNAFASMYDILKDDEYFFKIDDDIVFIKKGTFENMFIEYTRNNHIFLSANVVNHPRLSEIHASYGAIRPVCDYINSICDYSKISFCSKGPVSFNNWWKEVDCAKLAHESFFDNYEKNNLKAYDFGLFDFHRSEYHRYSINFFLSQGKYVNKISRYYLNTPHKGDDEIIISHLIPKKTKKHTFSLGKTLVCHYSYYVTFNGLSKFGHILAKYKKISETYLN
jgi:hypothetical protein